MRWNRFEKPSDGVAWRCSAGELKSYEELHEARA